MRLGFTGSRKRLTHPQKHKVRDKIELFRKSIVSCSHGDCTGGDEWVHNLIKHHFPEINLLVYPPTNNKNRAYCKPLDGHGQIFDPEPYLVRDRAFVDQIDLLIAAPSQMSPELHSGTWYTLDYAKSIGRNWILILPNGDTNFGGQI